MVSYYFMRCSMNLPWLRHAHEGSHGFTALLLMAFSSKPASHRIKLDPDELAEDEGYPADLYGEDCEE